MFKIVIDAFKINSRGGISRSTSNVAWLVENHDNPTLNRKWEVTMSILLDTASFSWWMPQQISSHFAVVKSVVKSVLRLTKMYK